MKLTWFKCNIIIVSEIQAIYEEVEVHSCCINNTSLYDIDVYVLILHIYMLRNVYF